MDPHASPALLRSVTAAPAVTASPAPLEPAPAVQQVLPWPRRTALVVGESPAPAMLGALHALGFSTAVCGTSEADRVAGLATPFAFLIVQAGALNDDADVALIRRLAEYSPSARVVLDADARERTPETLIRALQAGAHDVVDCAAPSALEHTVLDALGKIGPTRERVLAIGAHPDDVEIGCAGTLLDLRQRGERITILTLSRGAIGGDRDRRTAEAHEAAAAIGAQLIVADLPDTQIDDGISTIRLIEEVVGGCDPTLVLTHSPHDNHQDHRAVATATLSATRRVRRVLSYQSPSATNAFTPSFFVPIGHVLQRKIQVLMMFDSQNGRSYLEPELVVAGSRYWARHLPDDTRYAEPFEVVRSTGDLRYALGASRPVASALPEFGLPAYERPTPRSAAVSSAV